MLKQKHWEKKKTFFSIHEFVVNKMSTNSHVARHHEILGLHKADRPISEIMNLVTVPRTTVFRILKKWKEAKVAWKANKLVLSCKPRHGRPWISCSGRP